MANDGVSLLENTKLIQSLNCPNDCGFTSETGNELRKILNVSTIIYGGTTVPDDLAINYSYLTGTETYSTKEFENDIAWSIIYLQDGSTLYMWLFRPCEKWRTIEQIKEAGGSGNYYCRQGEVEIDVNGQKGPNKIGRDIFLFEIGQNGTLYPLGGTETTAWFRYFRHWTENNGCGTAKYQKLSEMGNTDGDECAARIMEEGWQMSY